MIVLKVFRSRMRIVGVVEAAHLTAVWSLAFRRAQLPWLLSTLCNDLDALCKCSCSFTDLEHRGSSSHPPGRAVKLT